MQMDKQVNQMFLMGENQNKKNDVLTQSYTLEVTADFA